MREFLGVTAAMAVVLAGLALSTSARAEEKATRCNENGCERIYCDETGDHCYHHSDYRVDVGERGAGFDRYEPRRGSDEGSTYEGANFPPPPPPGYGNSYQPRYSQDYDRGYGREYGRSGWGGASESRGYERYGENQYHGPYRGEYVHDYHASSGRVCDSDGDRCYSSDTTRWDFHEYYRRQGYYWHRPHPPQSDEDRGPCD